MKRYKILIGEGWPAGALTIQRDDGPYILHSDHAAFAARVREAATLAVKVLKAKDALLVAYRMGGRTPEKALDTLAAHRDELDAKLAALLREPDPCPTK